MPIFMIYFIAVNFTAYIVMANDKNKARRRKHRTRESTLWLLALLGGGPGSYVAMQTYRHKTKHVSFKYGMPALAVIDLIIMATIGGTTV